ncbi:hypothetical protein [Allocoleopsis franciscana]|uniref:Uncharacterized protein n=1 Tax=Allocoleopsis franciscana PCC 7113 TaxID=1173027 RepID=K9WD40_9CYAN|nr:hypothetical protein [Allocoleopsis franciscana]AFZ17721.1 hypothetical protein Mic7113_1865 [Allocoleopsis franciscana PCC 7113]
MTAVLKKLTSVALMLSLTVGAFIVLAISVVVMTAESLVSSLFSPAKAAKKKSLKERSIGEKGVSRESQSRSRLGTSS